MNSRFFLYPFALLYGFVVRLRNFIYNAGILSSTGFETPIISVGNLSVGGTGKTPHVEYLIRLLSPFNKMATLSRGYGRKSKGFIIVKQKMSSTRVGDEPLQYKTKFPQIKVVVGEKRVKSTMSLLATYPDLNAILLDDAFQHRAIKSGYSILLTDFKHLFTNDYLLPMGNLREPRSSMKRAHVILVTKTPDDVTTQMLTSIRAKIKLVPPQVLFFTSIKYSILKPINSEYNEISVPELKNYSVLAFSGIAKPGSFIGYLKNKSGFLSHLRFRDHHHYTEKEVKGILKKFSEIKGQNKIIVTTEKDYMRLINLPIRKLLDNLPFYTLETVVYFIDPKEKEIFDKKIINYVEKNQPHRIFNRKPDGV